MEKIVENLQIECQSCGYCVCSEDVIAIKEEYLILKCPKCSSTFDLTPHKDDPMAMDEKFEDLKKVLKKLYNESVTEDQILYAVSSIYSDFYNEDTLLRIFGDDEGVSSW